MNEKVKYLLIGAVFTAVGSLGVSLIMHNIQKDGFEKSVVETLAGYFEEINEDMEYDTVLKTLYEESQKKDKTIDELTKKVNELEAYSDESNNKVIDKAHAYNDDNNYEKALAVLISVTNKTPEMEAMIKEYQEKYEDQIIAEVNSLVSKGEYEEAIKVLDDALSIVKDSDIFVKKKQEVENSKPQYFLNVLSPYESKGYKEFIDADYVRMGGIKYSNGFKLHYDSYAIFNLASKYTNISGIIGHIDDSGKKNFEVMIYADGDYIQSISVGWQNLPKEFSIDVTGIKQLKIVTSDDYYYYVGFAEVMIR